MLTLLGLLVVGLLAYIAILLVSLNNRLENFTREAKSAGLTPHEISIFIRDLQRHMSGLP